MKPYSDDLRLRIIETIQANQLSQAAIAVRFSVGKSFVEKLWQRFRTTGSYQSENQICARSGAGFEEMMKRCCGN